MAGFPFRFGRCTTATFGSVVLDMIDLPGVQADLQAKDVLVGGVFTSIGGTKTIDRLALKRTWQVELGPWRQMIEWAPVLRMWRQYTGPWILFDHTTPNLLTGDQRLLISWTNAAGTNTPERLDGFASLAVSGVTQMGPTVVTDRTLLVPVSPSTAYNFAWSAYGTGAWTVTGAVGWYGASGTGALSTSTLPADTASTAIGRTLYLDGSISSYRLSHTATSPASAAFAQLRLTCTGAAVDVGDPNVVLGVNDLGNSAYVVNIDDLSEIHHRVATSGRATLSLQLSEV